MSGYGSGEEALTQELRVAERAGRAVERMEERLFQAEHDLNTHRQRAEKAEALLREGLCALATMGCPTCPCPSPTGPRRAEEEGSCGPCWREELNRRMAAGEKAAAQTQER